MTSKIIGFRTVKLAVSQNMWKFIQGVAPPEKKVKLNDDDKKERQRNYDRERRNRGFLPEWKLKFNWLLYDECKNEMSCSVCITFDNSGNMVKGCNNFRHSTLLSHNESESHKHNCRKNEALKRPPGTSVAEKTHESLNKSVFNRLKYLFRNAHYVAKQARPYTDFVSLCKLDSAKGIDIGETYVNARYCQTFIRAIADTERSLQDQTILSSPFIAIISDGSTDVSSTEAEICYARVSVDCQVSTHFIGLRNVTKADSLNISNNLISLLDGRFGLEWRNKMVAMGTDGAAVMLGKKGGVVQRFREITDRPFIFAVHCSGHRLELAYRDAVKGLDLHDKCLTLLLNLYLFYRCSPLNRSSLKMSFTSLGKIVLIPTRVGGTRWLPHTERALHHLLTGYDAIIQQLEQMQNPDDPISKKESSAKARNYLKLLKDKRVLYWLHLLMDVVKCLSTVALCIQKKDSTLSEVWLELTSARKILTKYTTKEGPYLRKFVAAEGTPHNVEGLRQRLLSRLIQAVEDRFDGDLSLFRDSAFVSIATWPEDLDEYADAEVQTLAAVCSPAISACVDTFNADAVETEWSRLKTELQNEKQGLRSRQWSDLSLQYRSKYPNMFLLVDFLLTLPASSVDAERGFSKMKIIKNDWRSRLGDKNLTDLLLIDIVSNEVDTFDPTGAIHMWSSTGSRRPYFSDTNTKKVRDYEEEASQDVDHGEAEIRDEEVLEEEEEVPNHNPLLGLLNTDHLASDEEDDHENDFIHDRRDTMELQKKCYKLLLSMMD